MKTSVKAISKAMLVLGFMILLPAMAFSTNHQISITNFAFTPHGSRITVGDTVTWTNHDAVQHSATSDNGVWDTGLLSQGQSGRFVFVNQGTFPYHCSVHISMKDTIFVQGITGIGDQNPTTPDKFELSQNYPNPFNASTKIDFSLNEAGRVRLEIFDILGNRIDQLVDGELSPGSYSYIWNASQRSSGVFFYRLTLDNVAKTGRMTLLK
jgi:plastocyanin